MVALLFISASQSSMDAVLVFGRWRHLKTCRLYVEDWRLTLANLGLERKVVCATASRLRRQLCAAPQVLLAYELIRPLLVTSEGVRDSTLVVAGSRAVCIAAALSFRSLVLFVAQSNFRKRGCSCTVLQDCCARCDLTRLTGLDETMWCLASMIIYWGIFT